MPGKLPLVLPRRRLARITAAVVLLRLLLLGAQQLLVASGRTTDGLDGWGFILDVAVVVLVSLTIIGWLRRKLIWRLRNRLIVTYIFIGVIPVLLVVAMASISGYLLVGQFATFLLTGDVQAEVTNLSASNASLAREVASDLREEATPPQALPKVEAAPELGDRFASADVIAWYRGKAIRIQGAGNQTLPAWIKSSFSGVVSDHGSLFLRAVNSVNAGAETVTVVSSVPLDAQRVTAIAKNLGEVTLDKGYTKITVGSQKPNPGVAPAGAGSTRAEAGLNPARLPARTSIRGGTLGPPSYLLDRAIPFGALLSVVEWETGEERPVVTIVNTRASLLYSRLFMKLSRFADIIKIFLIALAVAFAVIELIALFVGVSLTRTITRSIANLYQATQHINRGDLSHRIEVKSRDQLATLETSFNSMSLSLEKLIEEQKEKERMQSELAIAQEVQATLFPKDMQEMQSLELHGLCLPARTVSGDYYDFLPFGEERLGIALGDISGKGISAALLMANVHSAVRVYEFGRVPARNQAVMVGAIGEIRPPGEGIASAESAMLSPTGMESPANVMWLLNRHLYRSTPMEKYMTLFLGVYDGNNHELTYSNAGHLPPILFATDGSTRKLDVGGTVLGLFDNVSHQEQTIGMLPGEILVAFSDGLTEPENEFGEFGEERLINLVRNNRQLPLARISEILTTSILDWIGSAEQPDDVTLVLARAR